MPIPLTPIERELTVFSALAHKKNHAEINKINKATGDEREKLLEHWDNDPLVRKFGSLIEEEESEGQRTETSRAITTILEAKEPKSGEFGYGGALHDIVDKKDFYARLGAIHSLASLPDEMKADADTVSRVVSSPNYREELRDLLKQKLSAIVKVDKLHDEGLKAIQNSDYLGNLFKYNAHYAKDRNHAEIFQMVQKAFLEGGSEGLKKLKYESKEFKDIMPENMRQFAKSLDSEVGEIRVGGSSEGFDLFDTVFKEKLGDFELHSKEEKTSEAAAEAEKRFAEAKKALDGALEQASDPALAGEINALVSAGDHEGLARKADALKGARFAKGDRVRNFLIGKLMAMSKLGNTGEISKAVQAGVAVSEEIKLLKGKSSDEQRKALARIVKLLGREDLERHKQALSALGKASYRDLSYFIENTLKPPEEGGEASLVARFTHNAADLFTVGRFENNCQSPGTTQSQALLGFAAHPSELTLGFYTPEGELIGFSFAHFLEKKGGDAHGLIFERPYSNHGNLKQLMEQAIKQAAKRVQGAAEKKKIAVEAFRAGEKRGFKTLRSPYVSKWYDCKGGQISGGEEI